MLGNIQNNANTPVSQGAGDKTAQYLSFRKNSRMAGSIAVWSPEATPKTAIENNLTKITRNNLQTPLSGQALSYTDPARDTPPEETFGFGDLLDMANPLQHVPLLGSVYREITGDDIKPISKIIGGALYGGGVGAGSALVGVIVEQETGRDVAGNIAHLLSDNHGKEPETGKTVPDQPEKRLENALQKEDPFKTLPASTLSFVDLGGGKQRAYETYAQKNGRTAGSKMLVREGLLLDKPPREKITEVKLKSWSSFDLNG